MKSKGVAIALFAAIVLFSLDRLILQLSVPPRRPTAEALSRRADPNPQLAVFLTGVHERTQRGDSIVLLLPEVLYREREAYLYRAKYHLAGRDVFLADDGGRAMWVAAWRVDPEVGGKRKEERGSPSSFLFPPSSGRRVVWAGHGGVLVRQR